MMGRRPKPEDALPSEVPERIGRYEILLPIASGGMATVYLARSRGAGGFAREVALKLTHSHLRAHEHFAEDLLEEAKLTARIRHRNVVPVLDAGDDPRGVFLVMEYVEGDTLAGLLKRAKRSGTPLPRGVGLRILIDVLAGLHAAHELCDENGVFIALVHRDFSPQNILVALDGVAQLTDFGVAKAATRLGNTVSGMVKGKISYMSPEQARGQSLDRRSDVWAAGVVAWQILAGKRLYDATGDVSTLLRIVTEPPPRLRDAAPDVPTALDHAVSKALTMDIEERYPTAEAFARALSEAAAAEGLLATHDEVASCVRELVGDRLASRRTTIAKVIGLRATMGSIADAAQDTLSTTNSIEAAARHHPGPHPAPTAPASAVQHNGSSDDELPTLRPPTREANAQAASGAGQDAHLGESDSIAVDVDGVESFTKTDTTSVTPTESPRPRRRTLQWMVLGMGAVVVTAGVALVLRAAPSVGGDTVAPTAEALGSAPSSTPPAPSVVPALSVVPAASIASAGQAPHGETLQLVANAPIRSLTLNGLDVEIKPGVTSTDVDLAAEESAKNVKVSVIAMDGRAAEKILPAGSTQLRIEFPPPVTHPKSTRPSATRGDSTVTLPANPYGKKR